MNFKKAQITSLTILAITLSACASHSGMQKYDELNENQLGITKKVKWATLTTSNNTDISNTWISDFNDPQLNDLISTALLNNKLILANAANVEASIKATGLSNSGLYPNVNFYVRRTKTEIENLLTNNTEYKSIYDGGLGISWELDLWGKLRNSKKSSVLNAQANALNLKFAQLSLAANIAKNWFSIKSNKLSVNLAKQRLESQKNTLAVIEEQYKNGSISARDVYLSRTDIETQKSRTLELEQALDSSIRQIKVLLGSYPDINLDFDTTLPSLKQHVPSGLPSELLQRRPDIIAKHTQWLASKQNAKSKHKARFPSFSLTANYGASSQELNQLDKQNLLWNFIGNITQPLFSGGALKTQAEQAGLQADAALYDYLNTALNGFNEVENALSNEQRLQKRLESIDKSAFYAKSGYELALEQYQSGLITYSTMLDSQRRWFDAERQAISLRNLTLQNRIDLHLALGGDFIVDNKTTEDK